MQPAGTEKGTVSPAELAAFTRQLGAMVDAGVDLLRALRVAGQHSGNPRLIEVSRQVALRIEDGRDFHRSLAVAPELFDTFFVEMARQGETDGTLGEALLAVADYQDRLLRAQEVGEEAGVEAVPGGAARVVSTTFTTLGILALGAAVLWGVAAAQVLPLVWLGPIAAFWSGVCLLVGAALLRRLRQSARPAPAPRPPLPLPPQKSPERIQMETEGLVRATLLEQAEELEQEQLREAETGPRRDPAQNGRHSAPPALSDFLPDAEGPRFN